MEGDVGGIGQARDIGAVGSIGGYHVGRIDHAEQVVIQLPPTAPDPVEPTVGQVVVGPVPREPQHFQLPADAVHALAGLAGGSVAVVCAVTGLRGVGKTQAAGAYARQRIADGWLVAWIPAQAEDLVVAGLAELADALGLRSAEDSTEVATARVRNHLQTLRDPALLVFDNVTDPTHVVPHLPAAGSAQIVLTSTSHAIDQIGTRVPVELFSPDTAVRFLTESTGLHDESGAREVARELGYLPLALAQAAARVVRIDRDFITYLRRHQTVAVDQLLIAGPGDPYPHGAAEAILLAVEPFTTVPIRRDSTGELDLLNLLSVLSSDGIARSLLAAAPNGAAGEARSPDDILAVLFNASLIEFAGGDDAMVVMHRLTQRVLRGRANHDLPATLDLAARLLRKATFPEPRAWQQRELGDELIRHINTLWTHTAATTLPASTLNEILALRRWAVRQVITSAALDRAIPLAIEVHADKSRLYGSDHHSTLASANDLARAYRAAGQLDEAIPMYERIYADTRRVLGNNHLDTLSSASNLAYAYALAGRLDEAIPLYEQALADRVRALSDDHPETLISANNLASAYDAAGRLDEAILLYEQTLADRRRVDGNDHPDTLISANNLASAYTTAGRLDEAISLHEQTLADRVRVLGHDHPETLSSVGNLASAYAAAGRLDEAIPLHEQTLANARRVLGDNHPHMLLSAGNVASVYAAAGRLDEAIPLHEQTLANARRVLGDNHPDTLGLANNLAHAYKTAGRLDEAISLHEQVLADRRRVLGDNNPDTLSSANNLASAYTTAGRLDEAIPLHEQVLADIRRVLGDNHPNALSSAANLAYAYESAGRTDEADALHRDARSRPENQR